MIGSNSLNPCVQRHTRVAYPEYRLNGAHQCTPKHMFVMVHIHCVSVASETMSCYICGGRPTYLGMGSRLIYYRNGMKPSDQPALVNHLNR